MDKELLESMNLDEDVKAPIELLIDNGFETIASCDGVLDHHKDITYELTNGYIALDYSKKALELIALFYEEGFDISIKSKLSNMKYQMYNSMTYGDNLSFIFPNHNQENSAKILKIIYDFINNNKMSSAEIMSTIDSINNSLKVNEESSNLFFAFHSKLGNDAYAHPTLIIKPKEDVDYKLDCNKLIELLKENFKGKEYDSNLDLTEYKYLYRIIGNSKNQLYIYFDVTEINSISNIIKTIKENENKIKRI